MKRFPARLRICAPSPSGKARGARRIRRARGSPDRILTRIRRKDTLHAKHGLPRSLVAPIAQLLKCRLSDAGGLRFESQAGRVTGKSIPSLWRDRHSAIKGLRPPEHYAGKFHPDHKRRLRVKTNNKRTRDLVRTPTLVVKTNNKRNAVCRGGEGGAGAGAGAGAADSSSLGPCQRLISSYKQGINQLYSVYVCMYVYIYIYYTHVCIYIYIERERERETYS